MSYKSIIQRVALAAVIGSGIWSSSAEAGAYDLAYTFDLRVSDVYYMPPSYDDPETGEKIYDPSFVYAGPVEGTVGTGILDLVLEGGDQGEVKSVSACNFMGVRCVSGLWWENSYTDFDPMTGALSLWVSDGYNGWGIGVFGHGIFTGHELYSDDQTYYFGWQQVEFEILDYTVTGLLVTTPVPAVPLPASLPMLAAGALALGYAGRRRVRTTSSPATRD